MSPAQKALLFAGAVVATAVTFAIPMAGGGIVAAYAVSTGIGVPSAVALRRRNKFPFPAALLLGLTCPLIALAAALVIKKHDFTRKQLRKMNPAERKLYHARENLKDNKEEMARRENECERLKGALEVYKQRDDVNPSKVKRMERQLDKALKGLDDARGQVERSARGCREAEGQLRRATFGKFMNVDEDGPKNVAVLCHRNKETGRMRFEIPYGLSDEDQKKLKDALQREYNIDVNDRSKVFVNDNPVGRYGDYGIDANGDERFTMVYHPDSAVIENNGVVDRTVGAEMDAAVEKVRGELAKEAYPEDDERRENIPEGIFSLRRIGDDAVALMMDGNVVSAAVRGKDDTIRFVTKERELPPQVRRTAMLMNVKESLKGDTFSDWLDSAKNICLSGDNRKLARKNGLKESYKSNIKNNYKQYEKEGLGKKSGRSQRI